MYELDYEQRQELGVSELPGSLREALDGLDKDEVVKSAFAPSLYETFVRAKRSEWDEYRIHVTDWEINNFLQTA